MKEVITKEIEDAIIERYLKGETARNIAKDYPQFNENTISRHIRQRGFSRGKGRTLKNIELEQIIVKEYLEDKYATFMSLAKKYELSDRTISKWVKKAGISNKQKSGIITHCNEHYFDEIDTPAKAYLLGFITADGAVVYAKEGHRGALSIEIQEKDIDLLHFAKKEINPTSTITYVDKGNNHRNVRVNFASTVLCDSLIKYGIVQNKSKTIEKVPIDLIPSDLLCYYFRGLIDGDGCIHKNGGISIYSGSQKFIQDVQRIIIEKTGVKKLGIYHGTSYFITWTSREDRQKLFDYLYKNLDSCFYYKRKYERIYNSLYANTEISD